MLKKYVGNGKGFVRMNKEDLNCCVNGKACKYTGVTKYKFTGFTYIDDNGDEQEVIVDAAGITDSALIEQSLVDALFELGYREQILEGDSVQYTKSVNVTLDSPDYTYVIYSHLQIVKIKTDGADVYLTRDCTLTAVCKGVFEVDYDTDLGKIAYDGSAGTQVGTAEGFAAGDAAGVTAAVGKSLDAENINYLDVEVEDTGDNYKIKVYVYGDCGKLTLNDVVSVTCRYYTDFA